MGIECETKFKDLHDEVARLNEEIRELKNEIRKTMIYNSPTDM